ncbi:MAG: nucleotidyltransferase domain-containing protein [Nanoarchaeota archaeon]
MDKRANIGLNENQFRILDLFTRGFDKEYYVREVGMLLSLPPRTAQLNLESLEKLGVLESITKGKIKNYKLRNNPIVKEYIKFTEIFKNIRFIEKDDRIKEIILKIGYLIEGTGLVFGSYAKGTQKEDSDLDIFVIGSYNQKETEKISELYNTKISVKNYTNALFRKEIKNDFLIREILNNHIVFKGVDNFIEIIYGQQTN